MRKGWLADNDETGTGTVGNLGISSAVQLHYDSIR